MESSTAHSQLVVFPDGTHGYLYQTMTYGDVVIIVLLVALLSVEIYRVWTSHRIRYTR